MELWIFYAVLACLLVIIFALLYRDAKAPDNDFAWWQFVSTRSTTTGKWHADMDRLGQFVGILIAAWAVVTIASKIDKVDMTTFNILLLIVLAYVGGVTGYQRYLKSKAGIQNTPQEQAQDEVKTNA